MASLGEAGDPCLKRLRKLPRPAQSIHARVHQSVGGIPEKLLLDDLLGHGVGREPSRLVGQVERVDLPPFDEELIPEVLSHSREIEFTHTRCLNMLPGIDVPKNVSWRDDDSVRLRIDDGETWRRVIRERVRILVGTAPHAMGSRQNGLDGDVLLRECPEQLLAQDLCLVDQASVFRLRRLRIEYGKPPLLEEHLRGRRTLIQAELLSEAPQRLLGSIEVSLCTLIQLIDGEICLLGDDPRYASRPSGHLTQLSPGIAASNQSPAASKSRLYADSAIRAVSLSASAKASARASWLMPSAPSRFPARWRTRKRFSTSSCGLAVATDMASPSRT